MLPNVFIIIIYVFFIYLMVSAVYSIILVIAYFVIKDPILLKSDKLNRFAIVVPSHDEELLISSLCESLLLIDYPKNFFDIYVIADNCEDGTVDACRKFEVIILERSDKVNKGKGHAIDWALKTINLTKYDAIFLVDADNIVDSSLLYELNTFLNNGFRAIQCNNAVRNRNDSWFTQILYVSRTIGNLLYHHSKYKLGLSSYLMGNGLCFTSQLLIQRGWKAYSLGEDWEYYAGLIKEHIFIAFAVNAKVYHQESRYLSQATSQRLRWSKGKFSVARKLGAPLLSKGLRDLDFFTIDSSLPLILPNYSLQMNLTIIILLLTMFLPESVAKNILIVGSVLLIASQALIFVIGAYLVGSVLDTVKAAVHIPKFLIWKLIIDLFAIFSFSKKTSWIRTERHVPKE